MKILHCPLAIGGHPQGLARAERKLGLNSRTLTLIPNPYNYTVDEVLCSEYTSIPQQELSRWRAVYRSLKDFDVLHYNFGRSLCPHLIPRTHERYPPLFNRLYNALYASWAELLDIRIARRLGKVIAVTFQGDDARQGDYCRAHYPVHMVHEVEKGYYTMDSDKQKRRRIALFDRYADIIYALNPDILNVLPPRAKFLPYANVDPREWQPLPSRKPVSSSLHVVHAPSHRLVKGTRFILDAFQRLKAEGIPFEYTLVEGLSNAEARKIYESADLLVDQLLAGFYGGLAVELMALGKPVICFVREEDMHFLPPGMRADLPIIQAQPATVYGVLKEYLTVRKEELKRRGCASRKYVEKWHDPMRIAAHIKNDYELALRRKESGKRAS